MAEAQGSQEKRDLAMTDYYFIDLILMLASSAKIDLAELIHPYYHDKEMDLARARTTINMIASLIKRTQGNLNVEEKKVLKEVLEDLQSTYVEKLKLNKVAPEKTTPSQRPLVPNPASPTPDVKDWIHLAQQEITKKKQTPGN